MEAYVLRLRALVEKYPECEENYERFMIKYLTGRIELTEADKIELEEILQFGKDTLAQEGFTTSKDFAKFIPKDTNEKEALIQQAIQHLSSIPEVVEQAERDGTSLETMARKYLDSLQNAE